MTIQFAPKTVTLVANTQNTLVWGLAEFSNTLGQDNGIIRAPISISFQVQNDTAQVCYIGLSYTTIRNTYNVSDRKSIAAVPANGSLNITPSTVPSIASIGPDILTITMTFISAASGNVRVLLNTDNPIENSSSGAQLFGLDDRSIQDYIPIRLAVLESGNSGTYSIDDTYTVPTGKRAIVTGYYVSLPQTPIQDGELFVIIGTSLYGNIIEINSSYKNPIVLSCTGDLLIADAGCILSVSITQTIGYNKFSKKFTVVMMIKEVF